jgi:Holliday junction DNA helicase RuvB
MKVILNKFKGEPVGIKTLSAALNEDESTIEDVIEPYLIQRGYIQKTHVEGL